MNPPLYHFCTVASPDYLPFAEALAGSLLQQQASVQLHVLVTDNVARTAKGVCVFYPLHRLQQSSVAERIVHKYAHENDALRWALKPVFLQYLLKQYGKIYYADNDLFFFSPFDFLFRMLDEHSLVLSPHWCSFDAENGDENFEMNFRLGLFNAGLVGVNKKAGGFLDWWGKACLHTMSREWSKGYFVDQRYLDAAPLLQPDTGIIRHLGCNIGSWNMHQNKRTKVDGNVRIGGRYPVVCIHFNGETIKHITNGNDALLLPYLKQFEEAVCSAGGNIYRSKNIAALKNAPAGKRIKQRLRLRTRLKAWLLYLSKKL